MSFANNWKDGSGHGHVAIRASRVGGPGGQGKYRTPQRTQTLASSTWKQIHERNPQGGYTSGIARQATRENAYPKRGLISIAEDGPCALKGRSKISKCADGPVALFNGRITKLEKLEFKQGMIFKAPVHQEDSQTDNVLPASKSKARSMTAYGAVFSIPRYLIVVALNEVTYLSVPLYTHENTGLAGKLHYQNEFISVRDGRIAAVNFSALSKYDPVFTTGQGDSINAASVAHIGNPISRRYELPVRRCGFKRSFNATVEEVISTGGDPGPQSSSYYGAGIGSQGFLGGNGVCWRTLPLLFWIAACCALLSLHNNPEHLATLDD